MMSDRYHTQLVAARVVDNAIWETTKRESASSVPPFNADVRVNAEEFQRSLELGNER
jgi:hypothetical protein